MEIKQAFIQKAIREYMVNVTRVMEQRMNSMKINDTGNLKSSPSFDVNSIGELGGEGSLSFAEYGRFVDMGVNKAHPLGGVSQVASLLQAQSQKNKGIKPRKFYSPVVYGHINGLIGDLAYGFTEEAINIIKQELQSNANNTTNP